VINRSADWCCPAMGGNLGIVVWLGGVMELRLLMELMNHTEGHSQLEMQVKYVIN
jgi:hypothetical protein